MQLLALTLLFDTRWATATFLFVRLLVCLALQVRALHVMALHPSSHTNTLSAVSLSPLLS